MQTHLKFSKWECSHKYMHRIPVTHAVFLDFMITNGYQCGFYISIFFLLLFFLGELDLQWRFPKLYNVFAKNHGRILS